MNIDKLKPGQVAWSVERRRMGNTMLNTTSVFQVKIVWVVIEPEREFVMASWNGNPPQKFYRHQVRKWRKNKPSLVSNGLGQRLATKKDFQSTQEGDK